MHPLGSTTHSGRAQGIYLPFPFCLPLRRRFASLSLLPTLSSEHLRHSLVPSLRWYRFQPTIRWPRLHLDFRGAPIAELILVEDERFVKNYFVAIP